MQYILTEKEYQELANRRSELLDKTNKMLQAACTLAAEKVPTLKDWSRKDKGVFVPAGCLLNNKEGDFYCDDCISRRYCPYENKSYSK